MKKRGTILGGLLLAVVVTGYSVSGTYAKYISTIGGTDEARVARWSFNDAQGIDLFSESYGDYAKSLNVVGYDDNLDPIYDNIVAPGTNGAYTFQLTTDGLDLMSEVKYKFSVNIKGTDGARVAIDNQSDSDNLNLMTNNVVDGQYSPIKFFLSTQKGLTDEQISNDMTGWTTIENVESQLKTIFNALVEDGATEKVRNPEIIEDDGITTSFLDEYTIYWKWDYTDIPAEVKDADTGVVTNQSDINLARLISKYDTKLGQKAAKAGVGENAVKVKLQVEITAEQVK